MSHVYRDAVIVEVFPAGAGTRMEGQLGAQVDAELDGSSRTRSSEAMASHMA